MKSAKPPEEKTLSDRLEHVEAVATQIQGQMRQLTTNTLTTLCFMLTPEELDKFENVFMMARNSRDIPQVHPTAPREDFLGYMVERVGRELDANDPS